jgi:hypothetical protein
MISPSSLILESQSMLLSRNLPTYPEVGKTDNIKSVNYIFGSPVSG